MKGGSPSTEIADADATAIGRLSRWVVGIGGYSLFAWFYDYVVYSVAIWYLGAIWGGIVMTVLTVPVDLYCLKAYDWSKTDWLAIEYLKSLREYSGDSKWRRGLGWAFRVLPTWALVLLLSLKFNAFLVTAFLREGSYSYQGLSRRDWMIFFGSSIATQVYWIVVIVLGIEGVRLFIE